MNRNIEKHLFCFIFTLTCLGNKQALWINMPDKTEVGSVAWGVFLPLQCSSWKIMTQPQWHSSPPWSTSAARHAKSENKIRYCCRAIDLALPERSEYRCLSRQRAELSQPMQSSGQNSGKQPYQTFAPVMGGGRDSRWPLEPTGPQKLPGALKKQSLGDNRECILYENRDCS